jgi:magnesium-protoporphyrin O-methyltransferase
LLDIVQHKAQLQAYFDGLGFERWSAIYGEVPLSAVRRTIREGHARMLAVAEAWLVEGGFGTGSSVLDAGCGTGLFSEIAARHGMAVTGADIAPQMAAAAEARLRAAGLAGHFVASDLEAIQGRFDVVACFDVLVHYPSAGFAQLCTHLANLTERRLLFTYAPYSPLLAALHRVGGMFPKGQRRTEIQMIREQEVHATLAAAGLRVQRAKPISHRFYHVTLVEAERVQN